MSNQLAETSRCVDDTNTLPPTKHPAHQVNRCQCGGDVTLAMDIQAANFHNSLNLFLECSASQNKNVVDA